MASIPTGVMAACYCGEAYGFVDADYVVCRNPTHSTLFLYFFDWGSYALSGRTSSRLSPSSLNPSSRTVPPPVTSAIASCHRDAVVSSAFRMSTSAASAVSVIPRFVLSSVAPLTSTDDPLTEMVLDDRKTVSPSASTTPVASIVTSLLSDVTVAPLNRTVVPVTRTVLVP